MDHNRFDYDVDLLFNIKEFLQYTGVYNTETCDLKLPGYLFDIPNNIKKEFFEIEDKQVNIGCFGYTS